jgi:hypothetical protein
MLSDSSKSLLDLSSILRRPDDDRTIRKDNKIYQPIDLNASRFDSSINQMLNDTYDNNNQNITNTV